MSNEILSKTASIFIDDAPVREAYDRLVIKADAYNKKIDEGTKKAAFLSKAIQKSLDAGGKPEMLQKKLASVNATLDKNRKELDKVTASQKKLQEQIDSKAGPSLKQQEAIVRRLRNEYSLLGTNSKEAADKLKLLGEQSRVLETMRDRMASVTRAQKDSAGMGGFMNSFFGNLAANAVTRVTGLVSGFFTDAIDEANQAEEATARFKSTLDNLGQSSAFDRLISKADEMAERFKYLDNDDVVAVFNKLIDYGKLTEQQMNDLLPVIIDFAAKQRITLEQSTSVIVKALEGNGRALKEYGINIADAKTEGERLNVVMTTLKEKVDGAGEAFQNTAAGGVAVAKQEFANLKEEVGNELIPVLSTLLGWVNKIFIGLGEWKRRFGDIFSDIGSLASGGPGGLAANVAMREVEKQTRIETEAANAILKEMEGRSTEEIADTINQRNILLAQKQAVLKAQQRLLKVGGATQEQIDGTQQSIRVIKKELEGLFKLQDRASNTGVLGGGGFGGDDIKKPPTTKSKKEDPRVQDAKELQREIQKIKDEQALFDLTEEEKEYVRVAQKYDTLRSLAHDNKERLLELSVLQANEIREIQDKYGKQELAELERREAEKRNRLESLAKSAVNTGTESLNRLSGNIAAAKDKQLRERQAKLEFDIMQSNGLKKLDLRKQQLEEERDLALQNTELTESERAIIEADYRQRKMEMEMQFWTNLFFQITSFAQDILDITNLDNQAETNKENAALSRLQKKNDKEKDAYKKLLDNKLISQQDYNRKSKQLDDQYQAQDAAAKKKQWERQQKADVQAAIISGAQAILSALTTQPFWLGLILSGVAAVKTKKQIDVIKSQPVPEFGKGGQLSGPRHSAGGMPVINPRTGRKEAEVEGGEVILSRNTVANNPDLVSALLDSSLRRNGASIQPWYRQRTYQSLDIAGISSSMQKMRYYESGGIMLEGKQALATQQAEAAPVIIPAMTDTQEELMRAVLVKLSQPSKSFVVFSEIQAAEKEMDQIIADARFAKK